MKNDIELVPGLIVTYSFLAKTYVTNRLSSINICKSAPCYRSAFLSQYNKIKNNENLLLKWSMSKEFYILLVPTKSFSPKYSTILTYYKYQCQHVTSKV